MFATAHHSSSSIVLVIYVLVFGALYFFYLRPRSKRQKEQRQSARQVQVGERAQTIGGFVGTVVNNDGNLVTLRSVSGAELEFVQSAIARKFDPTPVVSDEEAKGDK